MIIPFPFILSSVQVETNNPRPRGEAAQSLGIGGQTGEPSFQLADHATKVGKHAIGKLFLPYFVPDVFLRIELGRVDRQSQQADILRDVKVFAEV